MTSDRENPKKIAISRLCIAYSQVAEIWKRYWKAYGGFSAVLLSPYFHLALVITATTYPYWHRASWWQLPLSVLPNLLGFTLGGMAILVGISEARVVRLLSWHEPGEAASEMTIIVAAFAHFVIVQGLALLAAFLCEAWHIPIQSIPLVGDILVENPAMAVVIIEVGQIAGWGIAYLLFVYALLLVFATTLELFRVSFLLQLILVAGEDKSYVEEKMESPASTICSTELRPPLRQSEPKHSEHGREDS
jgi:hypothetical protein